MRIANCRFRLKRQRERFLDQLREPRRAFASPRANGHPAFTAA